MTALHRLIFAVLVTACQSISDAGSLSAYGERGRPSSLMNFIQQWLVIYRTVDNNG